MKHPRLLPNRITLFMLAIFPATLVAACGGDPESSGFTVVEELRGDTVVMVSSGELERLRVEAAGVFWRSDELGLVGGPLDRMAPVGQQLVIGDQERIHLVPIRGGGGHSFGREGDGPGEFKTMYAVGELGSDTVGVYDLSLQRVSLFSVAGDPGNRRDRHRPGRPRGRSLRPVTRFCAKLVGPAPLKVRERPSGISIEHASLHVGLLGLVILERAVS